MSAPQRVVITAGGAGIGLALALAFHNAGARVAVCDIDTAAIAELAKVQPEIIGHVANVTNVDDMAAFWRMLIRPLVALMWHWQMPAPVALQGRLKVWI